MIEAPVAVSTVPTLDLDLLQTPNDEVCQPQVISIQNARDLYTIKTSLQNPGKGDRFAVRPGLEGTLNQVIDLLVIVSINEPTLNNIDYAEAKRLTYESDVYYATVKSSDNTTEVVGLLVVTDLDRRDSSEHSLRMLKSLYVKPEHRGQTHNPRISDLLWEIAHKKNHNYNLVFETEIDLSKYAKMYGYTTKVPGDAFTKLGWREFRKNPANYLWGMRPNWLKSQDTQRKYAIYYRPAGPLTENTNSPLPEAA